MGKIRGWNVQNVRVKSNNTRWGNFRPGANDIGVICVDTNTLLRKRCIAITLKFVKKRCRCMLTA